MPVFRLKHSFTSGELSPLMDDRVDFERYKNGCKILYNAFCTTQGPAARRPGFKFIYDISSLGLDPANPQVRMIPFIFNELQAYSMVFFRHTDGSTRLVFGTTNSDGTDGLVTYGDTPITECPPGTPVTPTPGDIVSVTFPDEWDIENFDWAQSADEMYFAQSGLAPHILKRYDDECWELVQVTFIDQPADWSDANGWPEKVAFHQQRLVYGATLIRRQTIWMSKAGSFLDFGVSSPIVESDAVTFTLDSGTQNKVQWAISGKSLHVGTLGNEWTVSGSTKTALTPDNILAQKQTNNGSESNKPLLVGLTTLFVEKHGRTVNEFTYDYTYDSYKTSDMAILSPHLTEHYSIIDWTYQQTPDSIIWAVREDGGLLGITYQRQHKVVGWHRHDTQGTFEAVTCIPGNTREDDVWTLVTRDINGTDKVYLEKLADWFKEDDAEWSRFLDSHLVYQGAPTDTISGLTHLAETTVGILADGTVHPDVEVSAAGSIELNNEYSHVLIGYHFTSEIRPMLPNIASDKGTSLGRMQRITKVFIDLYKSLGMEIGRYDQEDGETVEEIPFRVPGDLTGQAVPLFTGWKYLDFPEGFDRQSEYFIRQTQPLPLTVRSVVDEVEVQE